LGIDLQSVFITLESAWIKASNDVRRLSSKSRKWKSRLSSRWAAEVGAFIHTHVMPKSAESMSSDEAIRDILAATPAMPKPAKSMSPYDDIIAATPPLKPNPPAKSTSPVR
jgi:hypothetical protein